MSVCLSLSLSLSLSLRQMFAKLEKIQRTPMQNEDKPTRYEYDKVFSPLPQQDYCQIRKGTENFIPKPEPNKHRHPHDSKTARFNALYTGNP